MDKIKKECDELNKLGLQMTGLLTTVSVTGLNSQRIQMLAQFNEHISKKSNVIVTEAAKINKGFHDSQAKNAGIRKDLAGTSKNYSDSHLENQKLKEENEKLKQDMQGMQEQLNTSRQAMVGLIGDSFDDEMSDAGSSLNVQPEKKPLPPTASPHKVQLNKTSRGKQLLKKAKKVLKKTPAKKQDIQKAAAAMQKQDIQKAAAAKHDLDISGNSLDLSGPAHTSTPIEKAEMEDTEPAIKKPKTGE